MPTLLYPVFQETHHTFRKSSFIYKRHIRSPSSTYCHKSVKHPPTQFPLETHHDHAKFEKPHIMHARLPKAGTNPGMRPIIFLRSLGMFVHCRPDSIYLGGHVAVSRHAADRRYRSSWGVGDQLVSAECCYGARLYFIALFIERCLGCWSAPPPSPSPSTLRVSLFLLLRIACDFFVVFFKRGQCTRFCIDMMDRAALLGLVFESERISDRSMNFTLIFY